jgi:ABC-type metal ion transport system substrate-binding protein
MEKIVLIFSCVILFLAINGCNSKDLKSEKIELKTINNYSNWVYAMNYNGGKNHEKIYIFINSFDDYRKYNKFWKHEAFCIKYA